MKKDLLIDFISTELAGLTSNGFGGSANFVTITFVDIFSGAVLAPNIRSLWPTTGLWGTTQVWHP